MPGKRVTSVLRRENEVDFVLKPGQKSCWITVDNLSIHVSRTPDGAKAEIYALGQEDADPVAECAADAGVVDRDL